MADATFTRILQDRIREERLARLMAESDRDRYKILAGAGLLILRYAREQGLMRGDVTLVGLLQELEAICPGGELGDEPSEELLAEFEAVGRLRGVR